MRAKTFTTVDPLSQCAGDKSNAELLVVNPIWKSISMDQSAPWCPVPIMSEIRDMLIMMMFMHTFELRVGLTFHF